MALLNEILQGRFNALLTRYFNITGGAPAPQLAPEVMPVMDFADPTDDLHILQSVLLFGAGFNIGGTAAKHNTVRLRNPTGSGILAVLEYVQMSSQATPGGDTFGLGFGAVTTDLAQLPPAPGVTGRDGRHVQKGALNLTFDASPPGELPVNMNQWDQTLGNPVPWTVPIIIPPGYGVDLFNSAVNFATRVGYAWRERPMAPGEVGPF